jgi:chemotaxis protein CheY-P-specific phosphatase CheC
MIQQYTLATDTITLIDRNLDIWRWLVSRGIANSISGLSRMAGHELNVIELDANYTIDSIVELTEYCDEAVVGIYLTITGDATGHVVIVHNTELVSDVTSHQMHISPGLENESGELDLSYIEEMGNTAGAFFLNVLSDFTNLHLLPSPPRVTINTSGTIIEKVFDPIFYERNTIFTVKAEFGDNRQQSKGTLFFIPTPELVRMILENAKITQDVFVSVQEKI